jgi:excisionase family DNA binding protein
MDSWIDENAPLLTISEAATFLNVSKATIRRWTDDGRVACSRIGARKERRFRKSDLVDLVNTSQSKQSIRGANEAGFPFVHASNSLHQCIVSSNLDEEWATLGQAILAALEDGAQVLMVEVADRKKRLEKLLRDQGLSKGKLLASHALSCVSIEDSYFLSGEFRWERAVAFIESAILTAKARGFEKILIIGADSAQAESEGHSHGGEMTKYELGLDEMLSRHPNATVLCPYTASELSAELMLQGFKTHSQMRVHTTPVPGFLGRVAV